MFILGMGPCASGFCHEGITVEDALTYSIGSRPQTSEMLGDWGHISRKPPRQKITSMD